VQFLVARSQTGQPVGLVTCFAADLRSGVASLAAHIGPEFIGAGLIGDALALFIEYVLGLWNFRILYAEVPEYNYSQLASGAGTLFSEEARVPERYWHRGRLWDNVILAVRREHWQTIAPRLLRAVRGHEGAADS